MSTNILQLCNYLQFGIVISTLLAMANAKSKEDWNDFAETLKSAAHPERIAILHLMCNCGSNQMMVKEIYEKLLLAQSITSRHLGIMKKSGLLRRQIKEGKIFYRFNKDNPVAQCIRKFLKK